MEIERKFLLLGVPDFSGLSDVTSSHLRQAYVTRHANGVVRVRQDNNEDYILTVKGSGTLSREEYEKTIEPGMARLLFSMATGTVIEKTRYYVSGPERLVHEVDVFSGDLAGLVLMEVEFPDEASARSYVPSLFAELIIREVTEESRYSNSNLSLCGIPT
jgi:CYTH domain-containing protein